MPEKGRNRKVHRRLPTTPAGTAENQEEKKKIERGHVEAERREGQQQTWGTQNAASVTVDRRVSFMPPVRQCKGGGGDSLNHNEKNTNRRGDSGATVLFVAVRRNFTTSNSFGGGKRNNPKCPRNEQNPVTT